MLIVEKLRASKRKRRKPCKTFGEKRGKRVLERIKKCMMLELNHQYCMGKKQMSIAERNQFTWNLTSCSELTKRKLCLTNIELVYMELSKT